MKNLKFITLLITAIILNACSSKQSVDFVRLDSSGGFAADLKFAPDEKNAPDRITLLNAAPLNSTKTLPSLNPKDGEFVAPISLRSLDTGVPLIIALGSKDENFNWIVREIESFKPDIIDKIKNTDSFKNLKFKYIQFINMKNQNTCLSIGEDGFFGAKSCSNDLNSLAFESVFMLIPMDTDAVQIRSLVLNGKECISTFDNPNLQPWQRVGILPCQLNQGFNADISRLWAIMPELRQASILIRK